VILSSGEGAFTGAGW